jgi:hypothetical protein
MDYETLLVVQGAVLIMAMAAVLAAWRLDPTLRGVGEYALGTTLLAVGMLVLAALGLAFPNLGAVVSNVILLAGFTLLRSGLRRLNGQPPPS